VRPELAPSSPPGHSIALLERDAQLALIKDAVTDALAGRASIVIIDGTAGSGKSRLADEARQAAELEGLAVLFATGREREVELNFGVAWQLFEQEVDDVSEREREVLLSGDAKGSAPLLLSGPGNPVVNRDPTAVVHGLYGLLVHLSRRRPLALVIDDAHLSDLFSLRSFLYLAERLERRPVALLMTVGPAPSSEAAELIAELARHPLARSAHCLPLSRDGVAASLRESLFHEATDEVCDACFEVTRGNPLHLVELASELRGLDLEPADSSADLVRSLGPQSVEEALRLRISRRNPAALPLARAAAVAGGEAELRHCASLAEIDLDEASRLADILVDEGALRVSDRVEFVQPIVQRALYLHQPPAQRSEMHLRLARMLAGERADIESVASHLLNSPRMGSQWVGESLTAAASAALARGDPQAAIRYLRRALKEPADTNLHARVMLALGRAEAVAGEAGAVAHLREAAELLDDPHKRALVSLNLGRTMFGQGRVSDAAEAFRRGVPDASNDRALTLRLQVGHSILARIGGFDRSGTTRVAPAPPAGDRDDGPGGRMLLAHQALGRALDGGTRDEVLELAHGALSGGTLLREDTPEGVCFHFAVMALVIAEDLQGAEITAAMAAEEAKARGLLLGRASAFYLRAWAFARRGLLRPAADCARNALAAREYGWRLGVSSMHGVLGYALAQMGRPDEARVQFDLGRERSSGDGGMPLPVLEAVRARFLLETGDPEAALADYRECELMLAQSQISNPACVEWRSGVALARHQLGQDAEGLVDKELALARRFGAPGAIAQALEAQAALREGRERIDILEEAAQHARSSQRLLDRSRILIALGTALRHARQRRMARDPLREGLELAHRCGAPPLVERARAELAVSGSRPRRTALKGVASLTQREEQVARLIAEGLSNREVADALFVTVKTVEWHVKNVFTKLEVGSRQELPTALIEGDDQAPDGSA
jgi:DNA-binding NarL/FixJ family response regulator